MLFEVLWSLKEELSMKIFVKTPSREFMYCDAFLCEMNFGQYPIFFLECTKQKPLNNFYKELVQKWSFFLVQILIVTLNTPR